MYLEFSGVLKSLELIEQITNFFFSVFSSDTYSYYNSLDNHRDKGPIGIFGGEVIPVYSNVENGLGSIISTNSQIIQIKP